MSKLSYLAAGQNLLPGDWLVSQGGLYFAGIAPNGAFGVFAGTPENPLGLSASMATSLSGPSYITMESDGNLCWYRGTQLSLPSLLWSTSTFGGPNFAVMQDDGNLCVYAGSGPSSQGPFKWGTIQQGGRVSNFGHYPYSPYLVSGQYLSAGDFLVSQGQKYFAGIGPGGEFGVFAGTPSNPVGVSWKTATPAPAASFLAMQADGNFCWYQGSPSNNQGGLFCASTQGEQCFAVMQDDGNLCIYAGADGSHQGQLRWGSIQNGGVTSNFPPYAIPGSVSGVRVHCLGAFEMRFCVGGPNDTSTDFTDRFAVGQSQTISMALTPSYYTNQCLWPAGSSIYPIANIYAGTSGHGASENVTFDPRSPDVAVYDCTGTTYYPSFSFQENSSDIGSNFSDADSSESTFGWWDALAEAGGLIGGD